MTLLESTRKPRAALAQSAIFAMSLGAKELFHTNFLGFLLESQDEQLAPLQVALRDVLGLPVQETESSACAVWRERHNLDLVVVPLAKEDDEGEQDGVTPVISRCLVVEAKLKSIPTYLQLERYLDKRLSLPYPTPESKEKRVLVNAEVVRRVLLTPTLATVHPQWVGVSWWAICRALQQSTIALDEESKLRSILEDYAQALNDVLEVVLATRERVGQLLAAGNYSELHQEVGHEEVRRLRLHDLIGKVAFDEWVTKLHAELTPMLHEQQRSGEEVPLVTPYVHFSRSQAGLDLETTCGIYNIGVQVQGMQLRRYVSIKDPRAAFEEEVLADERLMDGWLAGSCCGRLLAGLGTEPPTRRRREPQAGKKPTELRFSTLRAFNAKKFLYSAIDLTGLKMADVHTAILDSMLVGANLAAGTRVR